MINFDSRFFSEDGSLKEMYDDPVQRAKDIREFSYKVEEYETCPYEPNAAKKYDCGWRRVCDYCPEHNYTTFKEEPEMLLRMIKVEVDKAREEVDEQRWLVGGEYDVPLERLRIVQNLIEEYLDE